MRDVTVLQSSIVFSTLAAYFPQVWAEPPADPDLASMATVRSSSMKLIDLKDEIQKLERKLHLRPDKQAGDANPSPIPPSEGNPSAATTPQCRPNVDVIVEVKKDTKCRQLGYGILDNAVIQKNRTNRPASAQIEVQAHSGGTGPIKTRVQTFVFAPNEDREIWWCATAARILKCSFGF